MRINTISSKMTQNCIKIDLSCLTKIILNSLKIELTIKKNLEQKRLKSLRGHFNVYLQRQSDIDAI